MTLDPPLSRRNLVTSLGTIGALSIGTYGFTRYGPVSPFGGQPSTASDIGGDDSNGTPAGIGITVDWTPKPADQNPEDTTATDDGQTQIGGDDSTETPDTTNDGTESETQTVTRVVDRNPGSTKASTGLVTETRVPALAVNNILPGDSGEFKASLRLDSLPRGTPGAELWIKGALRLNAENTHREPEREAGDDTPDVGELAQALRVTIWKDAGKYGLGACNGRRKYREPLVVEEKNGRARTLRNLSLTTTMRLLEDGVRLSERCLRPGDRCCIGMTWRLPTDVGSEVQSDSVVFDLVVTAKSPCDGESPFTGIYAPSEAPATPAVAGGAS